MAESGGKAIIAKALAVAILCGGIASGFAIYGSYRNSLESPVWPQAEGRILESSIVGVSRGFRADVRYLYQVNGVRHHGRRITYQRQRGDRSEAHARQVTQRYPPEGRVQVHYRPDRPGVSVLEPGEASRPVGGAMLVMIFLVSAAVLWRDPSALDAPIKRRSAREKG